MPQLEKFNFLEIPQELIDARNARPEPIYLEQLLLEQLIQAQKQADLLYKEYANGFHTEVYREDMEYFSDSVAACVATCEEIMADSPNMPGLRQLYQKLKNEAEIVFTCARDMGVLAAPKNTEGDASLFNGPATFPLLYDLMHRRRALVDTIGPISQLSELTDRLKQCDPWYMRSSDEFVAMKQAFEQITAYERMEMPSLPPRMYENLAKTCQAYLDYKKDDAHKSNSGREAERIRLAEDLLKFAQNMEKATSVNYGVEERMENYRTIMAEQLNQRRAYSDHLAAAASSAKQDLRNVLHELFPHDVLMESFDKAVYLFKNTPLPRPDSEQGVQLRQIIAAHMLHEQMEIAREQNGGQPGELERSLLQDIKTPEQARQRLKQTVVTMAASEPMCSMINERLESPEKLESIIYRNGMRRFARDCLKEWQPVRTEIRSEGTQPLQVTTQSMQFLPDDKPKGPEGKVPVGHLG